MNKNLFAGLKYKFPLSEPFKSAIMGLERHLISTAIKKTSGNITQAAKLLRLNRIALIYKMKVLKIKRLDYVK